MPQDNQQTADWYGEDVATFGDRLAAARDAAGLKPAEFAKRLGVKKATVLEWEADLNEPRANRLSMMAGLLNVSVMWLLNGEGEGLDAPGEENPDADVLALLTEMRDIRSQVKLQMDRLARVEKALRIRMTQNG